MALEHLDPNTDDGQEGGNSFQNPNEFISKLGGSDGEAPATLEIPEKFGEVERDPFIAALGEASGGKIKSYEDFKRFESISDKYGQVEKELNQLRAQSKKNPFANDLVSKLNDLYNNGAKQGEIDLFLKVQNMNIEEMSALEVLRVNMKHKYPGLTQEEIDAQLEDKYGTLDIEEMEAAKRGTLKMEAAQAKTDLSQLKVDAGLPESVRAQKAQQEAWKQKVSFWGNVNQSQFAKLDSHKIQVKDKDGNDVDIDFQLPKDSRDAFVNQVLMPELTKYAAQNFGPNTSPQEYHQAMTELKDRFLWATYHKEMVQAMYHHATASTKQKTLQEQHNVDPLPRGKQETKVELSSETEEFFASQKAKGLGR